LIGKNKKRIILNPSYNQVKINSENKSLMDKKTSNIDFTLFKKADDYDINKSSLNSFDDLSKYCFEYERQIENGDQINPEKLEKIISSTKKSPDNYFPFKENVPVQNNYYKIKPKKKSFFKKAINYASSFFIKNKEKKEVKEIHYKSNKQIGWSYDLFSKFNKQYPKGLENIKYFKMNNSNQKIKIKPVKVSVQNYSKSNKENIKKILKYKFIEEYSSNKLKYIKEVEFKDIFYYGTNRIDSYSREIIPYAKSKSLSQATIIGRNEETHKFSKIKSYNKNDYFLKEKLNFARKFVYMLFDKENESITYKSRDKFERNTQRLKILNCV
jgi:hypothetical protein